MNMQSGFLGQSVGWQPTYTDESAWIEHVPFAFWLIEALKPRSFVELGVHNGVSYFAFCQAIKHLNLNTVSYAVDTWEGDEHAGFYGQNVFNKVSDHNNEQYSRFSTLVRSTFDEANKYFPNQSIALLHIDGLHTYDAVKHDFETWLPKLTPNAVVLFHDINVRERNFGVYKFWEELKGKYAHFEFHFGHGLGVMCTGRTESQNLLTLFENNGGGSYQLLRNLCSETGRRIKKEYQLSVALAQHSQKLGETERQLAIKKQELESSNQQLLHLNDELETLRIVSAELNNKVELAQRLYQEQTEYIQVLDAKLQESNSEIEKHKSLLESANAFIAQQKTELTSVREDKKNGLMKLTRELGEAMQARKALTGDLTLVRQQANRLSEDNEQLLKAVYWYRDTFQDRSLPGVINEKLKQNFKGAYISVINKWLATDYIKNKYAAAYLLQYLKDNGVRHCLKKGFLKLRKDGFDAFDRNQYRIKGVRLVTPPPVIKPAKPRAPEYDLPALQKEILSFVKQPLISVIIPTYNTPPDLLETALNSVVSQIYTNWELCIADDCSTHTETVLMLKRFQSEKIKVLFLDLNSGISEASNAALKLATGEYVALLDHDDELTPDALFWVVKKINQVQDVDIIYSDECKVDEEGVLSDFFYKPEWSPELLFNMMYTGHLTVYRKNFLDERVGHFRKQYDFSQDYDLMLRASEHTEKIYHVDKVLYHWRMTSGSAAQGDKPYARTSNLNALRDAARRRQLDAEVIELPVANRLKIRPQFSRIVSIIIPSDSFENIKTTVAAILDNTSYPSYEMIVVTNTVLANRLKNYLPQQVIFKYYDKPYNFSDKCNAGAAIASGEFLLFFNDDVRPLSADWLEHTIEYLLLDGVGGTSPKLIYEDNTIQYAGMATGVRNLTGTTFHCLPKESLDYFNFPQLVRDVSILSGACMAVKKDLFWSVGGFDTLNTPIGHSDVDLSFKILQAGYRCVYTPYATLLHIGHMSLSEFEAAEKMKAKKAVKERSDAFLLKRWPYFLNDPFFTHPMAASLFHDSPEPFRIYPAAVPWHRNETLGDILLVSHELSLSGAPLMLYHLSLLLKELGYFVVVVCPEEGPLQELYNKENITVIVDSLVYRNHNSFERFGKNFDYIICNTIISWPVVQQMQDKTTTIWWIHEGMLIEQLLHDRNFASTLSEAQNIVAISDYSISFFKPLNTNYQKIRNFCRPMWVPTLPHVETQKLILSIVGSIEPRKGHDVLLDALEILGPRILSRVEVRIIGRPHDPAFVENLLKRVQYIPEVKMWGPVSHHECLRLVAESQVILNPSIDDPFPLVVVEALSAGKTCVLSTNSGVSELIEHGHNGYIFKSGDASALAEILAEIISQPETIHEVGLRARATYKEFLTKEVAIHQWDNYLHKLSGLVTTNSLSLIESGEGEV